MFSKEKFCERLKEARKSMGITQKQLGEEMGMLQAAYSRFECGKYQFSYQQLYYVATRLEVELDYLLGIKD